MDDIYDEFPINLTETSGPILRPSVDFGFKRIEVWFQQQCIANLSVKGILTAKVDGKIIHFQLFCKEIEPYITHNFSFVQISENLNRILLSNDLYNEIGDVYENVPDIASLFYKNRILVKVAFTIHNPGTLVELYLN